MYETLRVSITRLLLCNRDVKNKKNMYVTKEF